MAHRRLGLIAAGTVLLSALAAGAAEPTPGLPARLRVLVAADEMPEMFSFAADAGRPGFERELLEGFCRIHGLKLEVVPVADFAEIIPKLQRGEGDLITGIVDTAARRKKVAFTSEVFPVRHLAVTRRPAPAARVDDLRALRVGVIPGTSWEQAAVDAGVPRAKRVAFRDSEALLGGLRAGRVDAVVMALLDFALAQKQDGELQAGAFVGPATAAAIAVRPEDGRLLEALNGYLQGMRQARHALLFKYLNEEALSLIALARRE
jgi:ABC-type amino acid transport substrate-binding protein